jgi:hypothetical protein
MVNIDEAEASNLVTEMIANELKIEIESVERSIL